MGRTNIFQYENGADVQDKGNSSNLYGRRVFFNSQRIESLDSYHI